MKLNKFLPLLVLVLGLFASCEDAAKKDIENTGKHQASLTAAPSAQKIANDGTAAVTFTFIFTGPQGQKLSTSDFTATINFEATGGTVNPTSATTDENGNIAVTFTTPDPQSFKGGTVKGTIIKVKENKEDGLFQQGSLATATATILPLDAEEPVSDIVDEGLKKANELNDNTYVIDNKTITVEDLPVGEEMRDYIVYGEKKDNGVTKVFFIEFGKEHPVYFTTGGGTIHITPDMIGKEIDMLAQTPDALAWMNLFSFKDVNQGYNAETNPSTSVNTGSAEGNALLAKATCKITANGDGTYTALAYFKTKDGKEAYFKMKATRKANWSD